MAENAKPGADAAKRGDRRDQDRRAADRRREDRRAPPPVWRRPWAFVLYGVLGTAVILLSLNRSRPPQTPIGGDDIVMTVPPSRTVAEGAPITPPSAAVPEPARRPADFERLVAEGEGARGRLVEVELFCSSLSQVALRGTDRTEAAVVGLADASDRVPAAECKWGARGTEDTRSDFLLLVPPALAESFASAPVVDDAFVRRRRIEGVVEWVGRSDALALRTAGVLREYPLRRGL